MLNKCVLRSGLDACASGQESVTGCFVHDNEFSVSSIGRGFLTSYASSSFQGGILSLKLVMRLRN